jgi:hypothetical protein
MPKLPPTDVHGDHVLRDFINRTFIYLLSPPLKFRADFMVNYLT